MITSTSTELQDCYAVLHQLKIKLHSFAKTEHRQLQYTRSSSLICGGFWTAKAQSLIQLENEGQKGATETFTPSCKDSG